MEKDEKPEVPELNNTSFSVDTMIVLGLDKYPVASRIVATRPGTDTLDT
jgi:hypothetical protein